uniref:Uncharacterized protein n=1 Tax=Oryza glumipatula TaxID=40148 RepID=A0A0E0AN90_9ORYZ
MPPQPAALLAPSLRRSITVPTSKANRLRVPRAATDPRAPQPCKPSILPANKELRKLLSSLAPYAPSPIHPPFTGGQSMAKSYSVPNPILHQDTEDLLLMLHHLKLQSMHLVDRSPDTFADPVVKKLTDVFWIYHNRLESAGFLVF